MAESAEPALCPAGHDDTVKLLSAVAVTGLSSAPSSLPSSGSGCCGGACGCG